MFKGILKHSASSTWHPLIMFLLLVWSMPALSANVSEYKLKTIFLYNFSSFTTWPDSDQTSLTLCIYGKDPFGQHMDQIRHKKVAGKPIKVLNIDELSKLNECNLVFISQSEKNNLQQILEKVKQKPVLTVTDIKGSTKKGVIFNMRTKKSKVTFEVNLASADSSGLKISSKLLRLAKKVVR